MKSDFTFAKDDAHRFLPWQLGIMVALATLLLSLVLSLGGWMGTHESDYSGTFSVIIPGSAENLDEKTDAVKKLLQADAAVSQVQVMKESELLGLLEPWIGEGEALSGVKLPVVVDATIKPESQPDNKALEKGLAQIDPAIELDTHSSWAAIFSAFIRILQWLAVALVATVIGAMTLMITFSARASLHMHERTVSLLHGMGAEDRYIARQFQQENFKIGLKAAAIGVAVAGVCFWLLNLTVAAIDTPVLPSFSFQHTHWILLALMPFASAGIVLLATRYSVLAQLRKVL